jgi:hypothetical protein
MNLICHCEEFRRNNLESEIAALTPFARNDKGGDQ